MISVNYKEINHTINLSKGHLMISLPICLHKLSEMPQHEYKETAENRLTINDIDMQINEEWLFSKWWSFLFHCVCKM